MDENERTVMRRKRPLIVQLLPFTVEMQKKLRAFDLLDDAMLQDILVSMRRLVELIQMCTRSHVLWRGNRYEYIFIDQLYKIIANGGPEQTENGQTSRFLDQLMRRNPGKKAFRRLQELLRTEDYSWVAEEMEVDLIAERGELLIEPYVEKEAAMIVHKWFGTSKLIPEQSKSEIAYIVALRYQAAKEALMSQLARLTSERDEARDYAIHEEDKIKMLTEKIKSFVKIQKIKVNEFVNKEGAADAIREDDENRNWLLELEFDIDAILDILARKNLEAEKLNDERTKAFKVLGIQKGVVALDLAIRHSLLNASEDIKRSQRQADVTEEMASQLDSQLRNSQLISDREVQAKEKQIVYLEKQLRITKEKDQDLERELARLRRLLGETEHELEKSRRDMIVLKKTRHLGYVNPNWVEEVSSNPALVPVEDEIIKQDKQEKRKDAKQITSGRERPNLSSRGIQSRNSEKSIKSSKGSKK
ncbi:hypothetical protein LSH36_117g05125 [Paralvinella palmiformis]|uniref:Uncharacterized protein n=1 Tax=Paralvinella palmiformis TaxID=53620 RepID=A0AAD9NBR8_9ANNE|nr:hypothetical protein LSH36_117g05125 [Paralvinella palmiformis]